jgi:hypothetical protein
MVARALHENQKARLYKIPNDIKIVDGAVIHAEQTPVDFMGFTITGRVILLECKVCTAKSLPIGPRGLKAHQHIAISEAHKSGGIGLLAWQHGLQVAVIDAAQVNAYRRGYKSIAWKNIPDRYKHALDEDPIRFLWPFL